jgi:hypothetical protein
MLKVIWRRWTPRSLIKIARVGDAWKLITKGARILQGPQCQWWERTKSINPVSLILLYADKWFILSLNYSILLQIIILNITERKCQSIATIYIYIISFIWLDVSTRSESSSGHLNLLLRSNSYYKWNVSSLHDPIRLYNGYIDKTYFKLKAMW